MQKKTSKNCFSFSFNPKSPKIIQKFLFFIAVKILAKWANE